MTPASRRSFVLGTAALFVAAALPLAAQADEKSKNKVVFQVSDSDPVKWNLALNNMKNLQVDLQDDVDIELVVYGPGMPMLKADSPMAKRIAETLKTGAKVVACENTMRGMKLVYADMLPDIGYVPAGVVEVMKKQQQGYAYIRP